MAPAAGKEPPETLAAAGKVLPLGGTVETEEPVGEVFAVVVRVVVEDDALAFQGSLLNSVPEYKQLNFTQKNWKRKG